MEMWTGFYICCTVCTCKNDLITIENVADYWHIFFNILYEIDVIILEFHVKGNLTIYTS